MTTILKTGFIAATLLATAAMATPSEARCYGCAAGAGFVAGAVVGAAAANSYYGPGYYGPAYGYYEPGYAYAPGYAYGPAYDAYAYAPARRYHRRDVDHGPGYVNNTTSSALYR